MYRTILRWIRVNFGFSRTEANGYLVLFILLLMVHFGVTRYPAPNEFDLKRLDLADSILASLTVTHDSIIVKKKDLTPFNPNKVSYDRLVAYGVPAKIARNFIKYREAGGFFSKPDDLRRIYGFTDSMWLALRPWMVLEIKEARAVKSYEPLPNKDNTKVDSVVEPLTDINQADSNWFKTISGIGSVLSVRIIKFRDILGGFVSLEQLHEVYGLSPEVIARLTAKVVIGEQDNSIRKINLNLRDYDTFASHPYLSFSQARAIVSYREQHGSFNSIEELKKIHLIDDSTYLRVSPYLDF